MRNDSATTIGPPIKLMLPNNPHEVRRINDRRFVASVARAMQNIRKLSAGLGAPGPHDFAVRLGHVRLTRRRVHRIPAPRVVTIGRNVPLHRGGIREASF